MKKIIDLTNLTPDITGLSKGLEPVSSDTPMPKVKLPKTSSPQPKQTPTTSQKKNE